MNHSNNKIQCLDNFFVIGVNYKNTDAATRGRFSISQHQYEDIVNIAPSYQIEEIFILSTCNRTEIYGFAKDANQLVDLLCSHTKGITPLFKSMAYIKNGLQAIRHLYNVGSGLDSQILGDYEIVSQLKLAVAFSKKHKFIGSFTDRLVNSVLQTSKKIKTETTLSTGSVSVSFSAVKYIKEHSSHTAASKILVLGAGKIGRSFCKNLVDYFGNENITVINRSADKALQLSKELGIQFAPVEEITEQVTASDIILIATNAVEPILLKSHLINSGKKIIIDLSIPCNVEAGVESLRGITLIHVDQISRIKDENLKKRELEIPKAKEIIAVHIKEFIEWHEMRKNVPALNEFKNKLREIYTLPIFSYAFNPEIPAHNPDENIQRVVKGMALKMRLNEQLGCHYIQSLHEVMTIPSN